MLVQGHQTAPPERNTVNVHEFAKRSRVLGGQKISRDQNIEGAQGDVAGGADWHADKPEARFKGNVLPIQSWIRLYRGL